MNTKPWPLPAIDDKLRARLAHGARLRKEMMEQIARGEEPQPVYRARWLKESAYAVIRLLAARGEEFNSTHDDDAVSVADFLDSIWSARSILVTQAAAWSDAITRSGATCHGRDFDKDLGHLDDAQRLDHPTGDGGRS